MSEATVVTSENLTEFNNAHMGMEEARPASTKPEPKEVVEPEVVAEADDADGEPVEKPKKKPINERMSELTSQRRKAEEERDEAKRERDELRARFTPPAPAPASAADPNEPKPESYPDAFKFAAALAEFKVGKALAARDEAAARKVAETEGQKVVTAFAERISAFKAETPDYEEVLADSQVSVSDPVRDAIIKSKVGPGILYKLASDPELAAELNKMDVLDQLMTVGEWAAELRKPAAAPAPVVAAAPAFRAPAPIVPVRGTKTADVAVDSDGEFTGTPAQYRAARKAGKI